MHKSFHFLHRDKDWSDIWQRKAQNRTQPQESQDWTTTTPCSQCWCSCRGSNVYSLFWISWKKKTEKFVAQKKKIISDNDLKTDIVWWICFCSIPVTSWYSKRAMEEHMSTALRRVHNIPTHCHRHSSHPIRHSNIGTLYVQSLSNPPFGNFTRAATCGLGRWNWGLSCHGYLNSHSLAKITIDSQLKTAKL